MSDQAASLRSTLGVDPANVLPAVAITGGKGGVGKTVIAVNLALMLVRLGVKPLLVDFDLGLANADVLLNIDANRTLADVVAGEATLEQTVVTTPSGLGFVPAASGRDELTRLGATALRRVLASVGRLAANYDLAIIDTAAGIGSEVMTTLAACRTSLIVTTPDPTALADAYALIKVLERDKPGCDLRVVINCANHQDEALATFAKLKKVVATYLSRDLVLAATIPRDRLVSDAVRARRPFVTANAPTDNPAMTALRALAMRMKGERWK
jgi:flagellar biosynthesis protein FlhG